MKRLITSLLILALIVLLAFPAFAAGSAVSGPSSITPGTTFTVTFSITGVTDAAGVQAKLVYDQTKLTLNGVSGTNSFGVTYDKQIAALLPSGKKSGNVAFATASFTAKSDFAIGQNTSIQLTNISYSAGASDIPLANSALTVRVVAPKSTNSNLSSIAVDGATVAGFSASTTSYNLGATDSSAITITATPADSKASVSGTGRHELDYGRNVIQVVCRAENGAAKTYTLVISRNDYRSTDNTLSSLSVSGAELGFDATKTAYTVIVENDVNSLTVNAAVNDPKATLTGTGEYTLSDYANRIKIVVTAENETQKTYSLTIVRKDAEGNMGVLSANNRLSSLSVEGYTFDFYPFVTEYSLTVGSDVDFVAVNATAEDATAGVLVYAPEALATGSNIVRVVVSAENLETKTYLITVIRQDNSPTVTPDGLLEVLESSQEPVINLEITDGRDELTTSMLDAVRLSGKKLNVKKYGEGGRLMYVWTIDGTKVSPDAPFNIGVRFESDNEKNVARLMNSAQAVHLSFADGKAVPEGSALSFYVADKFEDGTLLNLCRYDKDTDSIVLLAEGVAVTGGFATVSLTSSDDIFATPASLPIEPPAVPYNILFIIAAAEAVLVLVLIIALAVTAAKKKKRAE